MLLDTELNGFRATIDYRYQWCAPSFIASIYQLDGDKLYVLASKSFGNGVSAEDWILRELSFPESILLLKYH